MEWLYDNHPYGKIIGWIILFGVFLNIFLCQSVSADDKNFVPDEIIVKLKRNIFPQEGTTTFSSSNQDSLASLLPELKERNVLSVKNVFIDENGTEINLIDYLFKQRLETSGEKPAETVTE